MQTLTLQVKDSFVPNLINILNEFKNEITIQKDKVGASINFAN